jgi:alkanesulfonate monooxygenase SsuD/methylene tetrahydromethanopterin reductase-like flavin-dependent oxidoreductase (luciferase family)
MRVSNFLFPQSTTAEDDARVIQETLREARLTDELGFDVIWLAEHHFDGICAYVDPVSFAAALATATQHAKIGFAVAQMALHHPIRMAEQISLIDHLSNGRLIVGLGRGTAYNIYDYQGFGIDHTEAQARFEEAEAIMFEAWKGAAFEYHGEFFNLKLPAFRPIPYTKPHPYVIRAAATEHGMLDIARRGRPFMMNVQSNETTAQRMESVPADVALHRPGRSRGRRERRCLLGLAQCVRRGNRCRGGTDCRSRVPRDARTPCGDAPTCL